MRKKGRTKATSPEKMPVVTCGINMSATDRPASGVEERLTGGNECADESLAAKLVTDFIRGSK
jgi:hypothetical protein